MVMSDGTPLALGSQHVLLVKSLQSQLVSESVQLLRDVKRQLRRSPDQTHVVACCAVVAETLFEVL
jgi:hypothetical protein